MKKVLASILILTLLFCSMAGVAENVTEYQVLAKGSKGEDVQRLQERLKELGYYSISVDGDYGNGTVGAVSGFQGRNGLEATGIADAATQELLYSENALPAPAAPNVEVTKVTKNREDVFFTVRNNLDVDIDQFTYVMCTYNQEGKIEGHSNGIMTYFTEDVFPFYFTENVTIKAHGSKEFGYDYTDKYMPVFQTVGIAVSSYHIISGETYHYDSEQVTFKKSDGTIMYPIKDNTTPGTISAEDMERANTVRFGWDEWAIPYYAADFYSRPVGSYLIDVEEDSMADLAGLKRGDVITAYDDDASLNTSSGDYAKLRLLEGQDVVVSYWRNGKTYTTIFSLDEEKMNSIHNSESEKDASFSVADELIKLADLLEKGIITQEEFDAQKAKLLAD